MPTLLQKKAPLLHEKLVNSLKSLNCRDEIRYLIDALKETKINNYAEAAIFLFTLAYQHPKIMDDPQHKALQKLCRDCYLNATPAALAALLDKPENLAIKNLFDQFVDYTIKEAKKNEHKPQRKTR